MTKEHEGELVPEVSDELVKSGEFIRVLKRNNKQIRDDRALQISEDVYLLFKRKVEDIQMKVTRLKRELEIMLDLSPENAFNLMPAKDFDVDKFIQLQVSIGIEIRNEEIRLEIAQKRYKYLFGGE
jgi:hypothetical protein